MTRSPSLFCFGHKRIVRVVPVKGNVVMSFLLCEYAIPVLLCEQIYIRSGQAVRLLLKVLQTSGILTAVLHNPMPTEKTALQCYIPCKKLLVSSYAVL